MVCHGLENGNGINGGLWAASSLQVQAYAHIDTPCVCLQRRASARHISPTAPQAYIHLHLRLFFYIIDCALPWSRWKETAIGVGSWRRYEGRSDARGCRSPARRLCPWLGFPVSFRRVWDYVVGISLVCGI